VEIRRNPFVAREGIPFLVAAAALAVYAWYFLDVAVATGAASLFFLFFLVFRDPRRTVPASPMGVMSPVDGRVLRVGLAESDLLERKAHRVTIKIDGLGTYTARSPVEGQIKDLRSMAGKRAADDRSKALWVQTDEGDDVVVQFHGYRLGLAPKSFIGIGQRIGQGRRCAYLRLTRLAELHLPVETKVLVKPGQVVVAGRDLIGKLTHR
jgi:phosphatidylserine decarboxylase